MNKFQVKSSIQTKKLSSNLEIKPNVVETKQNPKNLLK